MILPRITLSNTIGTYTLKADGDVAATGIIGTGPQALRKTGAGALSLLGQSSGNVGLLFDEGSITLDSTTGGSLSGAISTTAGIVSTGGITVTGNGVVLAAIGGGSGDTVDNTYVGTTTVQSGSLVANKAAGARGLTLTGGTINLNSTAGALSATSVGSILTLNGDVISTGASNILELKTAIMTAAVTTVDLGGTDRIFDVTDTLNIGTAAAPIALTNGGLVKNGTGNLTLTGSQTFPSVTINDGTITLGVAPPPSPVFDNGIAEAGTAQTVPEPGSLSLLATGLLGCFGRRRRA